MSDELLPPEFRDLAPFAARWALPTEQQRNRERLSSDMQDVRVFYEAMMARIEPILEHLNRFPLDRMSEPEKRLFYLTLSLAEVTPAVELFHQPGVVDGLDPSRFVAVEVANMTPRER
ncbi:MAG: hypothetical protein ACREQY_18980 [Candidatus Binatia bacterium]